MTVPPVAPPRGSSRRLVGFLLLVTVILTTACVAATPATTEAPPTPDVKPAGGPPAVAVTPGAPADPPKGKEPLVGGMPLFSGWPADPKPDAVIVFSGQTFGYLQPCGCSRPQTGGLERRSVFMDSLRAKGWPVAGVDGGDLYPEKVALAKQGKLKYVATMNALNEMGYLATGVGKTELSADLLSLLAEYALQKEQRPFTLAANAVGVNNGMNVPREKYFPGVKRPLLESIEVAKLGEVVVGVAGVVGKTLAEENKKQKWDATIDFPNAQKAIENAAAELAKHPLKPQLRVLIFQGPSADAAKVAADFPQFQVILCQADTDLPPLMPQQVASKGGATTLVVQVGHKGQHVGVLAAYKKANGGGFQFRYQLVPLGEEYITPGTEEAARKANKTLQVLEDYAQAVRKANLLAEYPRTPHPAQIFAAALKPPVKLEFVGTEKCAGCHAGELAAWQKTHHSHAMATLEKVAKRPSLRQFDPECVQCHTVGFHHQSGYQDETKTPHLRDVGCENCHGPGSGHVAAPNDKNLLALLSPWKQPQAQKLPGAEFMEKMAKTDPFERGKVQIEPAVQQLLNGVSSACTKCHDHESDPHFDLYKNWPKVQHTGLAPPGGWPAVPPKK